MRSKVRGGKWAVRGAVTWVTAPSLPPSDRLYSDRCAASLGQEGHGGRGLLQPPTLSQLGDLLRRLLAGDERMIRVVVLPFGVAARQHDILSRQPVANQFHVLGAIVVVHHIRDRHIDLVGCPDRIILVEKPDPAAIVDAPLNQGLPLAWKRLGFGVGDLTGYPKSPRRVAERTG